MKSTIASSFGYDKETGAIFGWYPLEKWFSLMAEGAIRKGDLIEVESNLDFAERKSPWVPAKRIRQRLARYLRLNTLHGGPEWDRLFNISDEDQPLGSSLYMTIVDFEYNVNEMGELRHSNNPNPRMHLLSPQARGMIQTIEGKQCVKAQCCRFRIIR